MRRWPTIAVCCLLVGCGFPTQDAPQPIAGDEQPQTLMTDSAGGEPAVEAITVWFIQDDVLVPIVRRVPRPAGAASAVATDAAGVTPAEGARGLRSAIPDPAMITGAEVVRGTAIVQLAAEFLDIPAGDQVLALGQLVYTLTDLRGIGRVRFEIDGDAVVVPLPSGDSTESSVSRDDFASLITPA
ncbi:MAG: GerMN domain-containing protein [Actinomycetota bacterium]|nr:GerMN domain-containing protein [Actinomycetota bacterium]